jgi:hypothetical protein
MSLDELLTAAADDTRSRISGLTPPAPRTQRRLLPAVGLAAIVVAVIGLAVWATRFQSTTSVASLPFQGADHVVEAVMQPTGGLSSAQTTRDLASIDGITIAHSEVRSLLDDGAGTVWLAVPELPASEANGFTPTRVFGFDGTEWRTLDTPFPVYFLVAANADALWVRGENGLARFDGRSWTEYTVDEGAPYSRISSAVFGADGSLWVIAIGMDVAESIDAPVQRIEDPTVATFDGQQWRRWSALSDEGMELGQIAVGPDGAVWIGSTAARWGDGEPGGIWRLDGDAWVQEWAPEKPLGFVSALTIDADGTVWAGFREYILRLAGRTAELIDASDLGTVASHKVSDIEIVGENVWFATLGGGIDRWDGSSWTVYDKGSGIPNPRITALAVDDNGSLWMTFDTSIDLLTSQERVVVFDPDR